MTLSPSYISELIGCTRSGAVVMDTPAILHGKRSLPLLVRATAHIDDGKRQFAVGGIF